MLFGQTSNKNKVSSIKPLSLKRNFSWTFIGNVIYAGCQWAMLVVLAKLGSPEIVGKFSLALAITAPIIMLTNLQLRGVQATDTKDLYQFGDYLGLRLLTSILAFFMAIILLLTSNYPIETILVVIVICIAKIIESISDVAFGLMQKNEQMDQISISKIIKGFSSLISMAVVIWLTNNLVFGTIALALSWLIVLYFYDVKNVKNYTVFKPILKLSTIKSLVKLSLPLGVVLMMGSLNTNIPRYFIEYYTDESTLGYFAALAYLIIAGTTVINALGQSASPRLARYYANRDRKSFSKLMLTMQGIGIVIGCLGIAVSLLFGQELLTLLYQSDYAKHSDVFILIMTAGAITYVGAFLGYGITAARSFKVQPIIGIIWVTTTIISSMLLIPSNGLTGAAYVLILSASIQFMTKGLVLLYLLFNK